MLSREPQLSGATSPEGKSGVGRATRLGGGRLIAARITWVVLFTLIVVPFALSLPDYRASFEHPSTGSTVLAPGAIAALAGAGVTLDAYGWISIVVVCVVIAVSVIFSLLLFLRRGDDWMALLVALFITIYPISTSANKGVAGTPLSADGMPLPAAVLAGTQSVLLFALLSGMALLFPTGRFVPRWSWIIMIGACIWSAVIAVQLGLFGGLLVLGYPLFIGLLIGCMVYRYRRVSTPVQRTQTRWIITGLAVTLIGNQAFWLPSAFASLGQTLYPPIVYQLYLLSLVCIPITFFVAIQRYRLYEIDTIINRALVYGSLTAILAAIYLGGVIGAQAALRTLVPGTGGNLPIITVATTLLVAALFGPLRRGIQAFIDLRFYRRKYDAAQILKAFGDTLRSEVDLPSLVDHLTGTVDEAMQPTQVSLWLPPARATDSGADAATRQRPRA
jgi:hypothetical protein